MLGGSRIDDRTVQRLVDAITAPPLTRDTAFQKLTSTGWLQTNASSSYRVLSEAQGECSAAARELFTATFTNRKTALRALRSHYENNHTDDFPSMDVVVHFSDGTDARASAHSQHALMLPWKTKRGVTWNPQISDGLASTLPASSSNRSRLLRDGLATAIAWEIGELIRDQWEEMEEKCLYSSIVSKLERHATIDHVYHAWPGQFAAYLHVPDAPKNLLIDAHISAEREDGVETFFKRIPGYVATARTLVTAHPNTVFELWYHDGQSLTTDSLQLHEVLRPDDPNLIRAKAVSGDAVLLRDHDDPEAQRKWIVLPSGEVIDWSG